MIALPSLKRPSSEDIKRTLFTIAVAGVGGWVAALVGVPLPWMIGAMLATTVFALFAIAPAGIAVRSPMEFRTVMVPVIGVMLGSSFTPEIVEQMAGWWITITGLLVFIGLSLATIFVLYRRVFGFDTPTAYFAALPGGVIEAALLGEQAGGDSRTISLIHFCRILLAVLTIPIAMRLIFGPVGSSAISADAYDTALTALDVLLLIGAGIVGFQIAKWLRMPGAPLTGPMIVSAIVHVLGWTYATPPTVIVVAAQIVMGASLGARFAGYSINQAKLAIRAAAVGVSIMLLIGISMSLA
ncbi:MAG: AbrB family transcriptional regulator, partial [Pseudomonadota bacterium]